MSRIVTSFDPSAATQGSFPANILVNDSSMLILNESSYFLKLDLGTSGGQIIIQPWVNRLIRHVDRLQDVYWYQSGSISPASAPISLSYVIAFDPGEEVSDAWNMPLQRITNVGNTVSTTQGAAMIVSSALRVHVTATGFQSILTYTPPQTGFFRVSGYIQFHNGSSEGISATVQFQDPDTGKSQLLYFASTLAATVNPIMLNGNTTFNPVFSFGAAMMPLSFMHTGLQPIFLQYDDPAGTPDDYVTFIIEKMA